MSELNYYQATKIRLNCYRKWRLSTSTIEKEWSKQPKNDRFGLGWLNATPATDANHEFPAQKQHGSCHAEQLPVVRNTVQPRDEWWAE